MNDLFDKNDAQHTPLWRALLRMDAGHGWCRACGAPLGEVNGRLVCRNNACPTNRPPGDLGWSEVVAIFLDQLQRAHALLEQVVKHEQARQERSASDATEHPPRR